MANAAAIAIDSRIQQAADLWTIIENDTIEQEDIAKEITIPTSVKYIDAMLDGGFTVGRITYVTVENAHQLLPFVNVIATSHLLANYGSRILLLDVMNVFNVRYLYQTISDQLPGQDSAAKDEQVMAIMNRMTVYKVFDFQNLKEVLDQIDRSLEQEAAEQEQSDVSMNAATSSSDPDATIQLLVVGDVSYVMALSFRNNLTQAEYVATTFLRSFHELVKRHKLCTVICEKGAPIEDERTGCLFELPAAGKTSPLDHIVDLHIHIRIKSLDSSVKQTTIDSTRIPPRAQAEVVEVVKDDTGNRHGRWTYRQLPTV